MKILVDRSKMIAQQETIQQSIDLQNEALSKLAINSAERVRVKKRLVTLSMLDRFRG